MNILTPIPSNGGDWLPQFGEEWKKQIETLHSKLGYAIERVEMPGVDRTDVPIVYAKRGDILNMLTILRDDFGYDFLSDLTATDETPDEPRFLVVYNLYSTEKHYRIRVKVGLSNNEDMPSIVALWAGANWAEREVFDMFGIQFTGHPDLRRILNDSRWEGYPLRKDYPIRNYQIFAEAESPNPKLLE